MRINFYLQRIIEAMQISNQRKTFVHFRWFFRHWPFRPFVPRVNFRNTYQWAKCLLTTASIYALSMDFDKIRSLLWPLLVWYFLFVLSILVHREHFLFFCRGALSIVQWKKGESFPASVASHEFSLISMCLCEMY